eukprot:2904806-Pyramimonas_sp.AAC.1
MSLGRAAVNDHNLLVRGKGRGWMLPEALAELETEPRTNATLLWLTLEQARRLSNFEALKQP